MRVAYESMVEPSARVATALSSELPSIGKPYAGNRTYGLKAALPLFDSVRGTERGRVYQ